MSSGSSPGDTFPRGLLYVLAICAGASVANLYYAQPLLALVADSFGGSSHIGWVAVAPMIGYTLSLVSVLPLADLVDRRRLAVMLAAIMAGAAFACGVAPSMLTLTLACVAMGFGSVTTQILLPMSADLVPEQFRARALGTVFSGVLAGILVARTVSGLVGQVFGWRVMFFMAGGAALLLALTLSRCLPRLDPIAGQNYLSLFTSMRQMLLRHPQLRAACMIQGCLFGVFTSFWSVLALLLAGPPFALGAAAAGAFGIVGIVGVVAANISGRLIERYGSSRGRLLGIVCCIGAYVIFAVDVSVTGLIGGAILMDFGMSIANVSSQNTILGLEPTARNRLNTLYVASIFLGGSLGAAIASVGWTHRGWMAVCALGLGLATIALMIHLRTHRKTIAKLHSQGPNQ